MDLLSRKLDRLTNSVVDIGDLEYKGGGDSTNQLTQHYSPWDMEEGYDTANSKEEEQQAEVEPTLEVGKHPPCPKKRGLGATSTYKIQSTSI